MTELIIQNLMSAGLTRQQATSKTAEILMDTLMPEDGKLMIAEARGRVKEMESVVYSLKKEFNALQYKIEEIGKTLVAISEAQSEYGKINEEKARTVIAMYGALLNMNSKYCKDGLQVIENAGYVTYAYLGGQARREITGFNPNKETS